jgi:hypothetical protein
METWQSEILRFAQNDKRRTQNDSRPTCRSAHLPICLLSSCRRLFRFPVIQKFLNKRLQSRMLDELGNVGDWD